MSYLFCDYDDHCRESEVYRWGKEEVDDNDRYLMDGTYCVPMPPPHSGDDSYDGVADVNGEVNDLDYYYL